MDIIYCAFSELEPGWVSSIRTFSEKLDFLVYTPAISSVLDCNDSWGDALKSGYTRAVSRSDVKMSEITDLEPILQGAKDHYLVEMDLLDSYVLYCSKLVLADLTEPSYGNLGIDIAQASIYKVPVIGLTHRGDLDSKVLVRLSRLVVPKSPDELWCLLVDLLKRII